MNLRCEVLEIVSLKIVWAKALLQPRLPLLSNFLVLVCGMDQLRLLEVVGDKWVYSKIGR
jgi:hypothetical protein